MDDVPNSMEIVIGEVYKVAGKLIEPNPKTGNI